SHLVHRDLSSFPTRRSSDLVPIISPIVSKALVNPGPSSSMNSVIFCFISPKNLLTASKAGCTYSITRLNVSFSVLPSSCMKLRRSEEHTSELQSRFDLVCRL